ncbi:MAG: Hsp70 family protein [Bacillota bacterium]
MEKAFGIDLGTTYSCIAYIDEFRMPIISKNKEGHTVTPSVVYFESADNIIVGQVAKDCAKLDPHKVVQAVKRHMGKSGFAYEHEGELIGPEEISSLILKKVAQDAEALLGTEVKNVVITCPAYFGISAKEATRKAGELAGLNVLSIVDEPVAAAIAYGYTTGSDDGNKVVLVYDLGGGTFDVTMIELTEEDGKKVVNVIATGGDNNLGGKNWDDALISHICEEFAQEAKIDVDSLYDDAEFMQDLIKRAEDAKIGLSQRESVKFPVIFGTHTAKLEITREKFEEITEDLLLRTIEYTRNMLDEAAKKGYDHFHEMLMVGGSTKMPQVSKALEQEFPHVTISTYDPDEAVAKGAALFAEVVNYHIRPVPPVPPGFEDKGRIGPPKIEVKPVCSKSYGVKAVDMSDNVEKIFNLITKNTNVPASVTNRFGTKVDNQTEALIVVLENDWNEDKVPLEYGKEIGQVALALPSGLPSNSPIEITYTITLEGILDVKGLDLTGYKDCHATIVVNDCISEEEFKKAQGRGLTKVVD